MHATKATTKSFFFAVMIPSLFAMDCDWSTLREEWQGETAPSSRHAAAAGPEIPAAMTWMRAREPPRHAGVKSSDDVERERSVATAVRDRDRIVRPFRD